VSRVDLRNRWTVLILVGALGAVIFAAGMGAAFHNRHKTICSDRRPPVAQRGGILGQTEYRCHNGQIVTLSS
jgi:hypothetical protein